jgi:hypothetical protein
VYHRGRVCTLQQVQAGASFPVRLEPCLHPCLAPGLFKFKHSWNCLGASCQAWAVMWIRADSLPEGCPGDAFGAFDPSQCVYSESVAVELEISPVLADGSPVQGSMRLEVPFLTNADIAEVAAKSDDAELLASKIDQYPPLDERTVVDAISLLPTDPAPPESCGETGEDCECFSIGF